MNRVIVVVFFQLFSNPKSSLSGSYCLIANTRMGFARVEPFLKSKGRTEGSDCRDQIILPQRNILRLK